MQEGVQESLNFTGDVVYKSSAFCSDPDYRTVKNVYIYTVYGYVGSAFGSSVFYPSSFTLIISYA